MRMHASNATGRIATSGLEPGTVSSTLLHGPLASLLDAQVENEQQHLIVFNPSPEADSLVEHVVSLVRDGTDPVAAAERITPLLNQLVASNQRERAHQHDAARPLDNLTSFLHVHGHRGLSVKDAERRLRAPLKTIRAARTEVVDGTRFFHASCQVKDVICELPTDTLRGKTLRERLGNSLHDVLLDLLTDGSVHA
jgi:hypothetical protein